MVVCLLFAFASMSSFLAVLVAQKPTFFAAAMVSELYEQEMHSEPEIQYPWPSGVTLRYQDEITDGVTGRAQTYNPEISKNLIRYYGDFGAYYNTSGYLTFAITTEDAMSRVEDIEVVVTRVGATGDANWAGYEDLPVYVNDGLFDDEGNRMFQWAYDAVGEYRINIIITWSVDDATEHETVSSCYKTHVHNDCEDDCKVKIDFICEECRFQHNPQPLLCGAAHVHDGCDGCGQEIDYFCPICKFWFVDHVGCDGCELCTPEIKEPKESELRAFVFYSVCRSSDSKNFPSDTAEKEKTNFGVSFKTGKKIYNEKDSLATDKTFTTSVRTLDTRFNWDESTVRYTPTCDLLQADDNGKHLILKVSKEGYHKLTFIVTFAFWYVDATGQVRFEPERTEEISVNIEFFEPYSPITIWDVLIGVAILITLGAAVWFVTKMSRDVQPSS